MFAGLWLALVAESVLLAPAARPDQTAWLVALMSGQWDGIDPWVVAHFNLMGVWPLVLAALLAPELRRRPVPLWPFALSSFAIGAFGLLPGLALGGEVREPARWQGWVGHRAVGVLGFTAASALVGWALLAGDGSEWVRSFREEQFVHIMAFDFVALWATSVVVAWERHERWWLALVPLWGAAALVVVDGR